MEWLRSILAECFPGAKLAGFDRIGLEHGLASTALRLRLDGPGAPRSVVVKYWSIDGPAGFEELPFYATFGRDLGIRIPLCYYGVVDAANKRVVLVLEDLEGAVQGNVLGQVDASGAAALARTIATLHAKWWESAELDSQTWLQAIEPRKPEWLRSRREMFMSRFGDQTDPLLRELLEPGRSGGGAGEPAHGRRTQDAAARRPAPRQRGVRSWAGAPDPPRLGERREGSGGVRSARAMGR